MTKIIKEINLSTIMNFENYLLVENKLSTQERYYLLRKIDPDQEKKVEHSKYINYYGKIEYENFMYEGISINGDTDVDLMYLVYNLVVEKKWLLNEAITEISKFVHKFKQKINQKDERGYFAEIYAIKNLNCKPLTFNQNSIYDLSLDGNDVEIKSFSKVQRTVFISYQQLINNNNAQFIFIEIIESSEGNTLRELFNSLLPEDKLKYCELNNESFLENNVKLKVGEIIYDNAKSLSEGLTMPKRAIDAKFRFLI